MNIYTYVVSRDPDVIGIFRLLRNILEYSQIFWSILVGVENQTDALQCPVRYVFSRGQVSFEYESDTHGVSALRCRVHWRSEGVLKFEFVCFDWDDLENGEVNYEFLGPLFDQTAVLFVPRRPLQEQTRHETTLMCPLGDLVRIRPLGDLSVESGPVQGPAVLPASGLDESCQVGLWDVQSRQPHDSWLPVIDPFHVLFVSF